MYGRLGCVWPGKWCLCLAVLGTAILGPSNSLVKASQLQCQKFSKSQSFQVERKAGNVVELHIRHNIQGEVEVRDGPPGSDLINIEIDKTAAAQSLLENVAINQTLYDIGYGIVYVLQVDYKESSSRIVTVIIGAVIAAVIFLALMSVLIWWYCKLEHRRFRHVPHRNQGGRGPAEAHNPAAEGDEHFDPATEGDDDRGPNGNTPSVPPPPPPRRLNGSYTPQANSSPAKASGGGGGVNRPAVVTLSLVMVISAVYAGCSIEPQVHIIVFIPPNLQLHAVKLFFNKIHDNPVVMKQWAQQNNTGLHVYDLSDATPTVKPPCSASKLCPHAYSQNLAGCDAATELCVCQRGYQLNKGLCTDIDECSTHQHSCPATATCRNSIGNYVCQCGYGYFGERRRCKSCSSGCPSGEFEASPCGNHGDRLCTTCTECKGSMYEVRPCIGTTDRQCMHAAHPLLITGEETTPTFLEGLKVEASENIFMENLHGIRNLESTHYVTDMSQASDFYWIRESGLQVNIGILNVNLIPEYEDVDHESDNDFMLQLPGESEDKIKFRNIIRNHCRHPIPDHYSLTLEISRDRITAAHPYICDSKDASKADCPPGYNDGDMFLHRTLNEPCQKMGTFPDPLQPAVNSYVCTQNTGLLGALFNQSFTTERPIRFPPRRCRSASSRCEQCLSQHRCKTQDIFEQQCCQIDCYTLRDCKQATSEHCASAPIECAAGDAYRYTIQPLFENIKSEFQCHIKRKKPDVLYQMFYYIMIPERKYETPRVYKTVYSHDLNFHSNGMFTADYLTVEHNTGLNLKESFALIGKDVASARSLNYTIHSMKTPEEFRKKKSPIHKMSHNVYVAPVQVSEPFAYSTRNWVKGDYCDKNENKFKSVQKIYNADTQNVYIRQENDGNQFQYYLKSADNPPTFRFMAPGNTSVLPWYFQDVGPVLITNESLQATLELMSTGRIWNINIRGKMSGCPAYLGVTINNRLDLEELFRYDLLIFCPAEFNLTFKVPNWGQSPDKTFDIQLTDSKKSYDVYLTHMLFEQHRVEKESELVRRVESAPPTTWAVLSVIITIGTILTLMLLLGYVYLECTKSRLVYTSHNINVYQATNGKANDDYCIAARNLSQGQVVFIVTYTVLRLIYSLLFTFTVFFAVLMLFIRSDFHTLLKLSDFQTSKYNASRKMVNEISQFGQDELLRQAKLVTNMQGACSFYIEELFENMQHQMDNITANQHRLDMYSDHSSISFLMNRHVQAIMERYEKDISNYTDIFQTRFDIALGPKFTKYSRYLNKLYKNDWFQFPQLLYNRSQYINSHPLIIRNGNLSGTQVDFSSFLEVEEVEAAQLWPIQFWQRYDIRRPLLPQLPLPRADHRTPKCDLPPRDETNNITTQSPPTQLDSSKFFAPHLPGKSIRGPLFRTTHVEEEYRYLTETDSASPSQLVFSVEEFVSRIDTHLLKIIFLVVDVFIVIYRCSRTYMTATTLCRGFEESVHYKLYSNSNTHSDMKESELQNLRNQAKHMPDDRTAEQTYLREGDKDTIDTTMTDYSTTLDSQKSMLPSKANSNAIQGMVRNDIRSKTSQTDSHKSTRKKLDSCRNVIGKILTNSVIPKILIAFVLLLLFFIMMSVVYSVLSVDAMYDLNGFQAFVAGLDVQVNQTNWYLHQQAKHFNDITMKIYENQMRSELLHLQSMLEYFNAEQKRLVKNYISEACAVKQGLLGNRPCDITVTPMQLLIPMLPCNFVPIQPQLYTGFRPESFEVNLGHDFLPYLTAARNISLKTGYAILSAVLIMLTFHLLGAVIFHFLRTRHKFTVHRVYISSAPPTGPPNIPPPKESESDSDDNESGFKSFTTRVRMSPEKSYKTETLLSSDFKYSETKV